MHDKGALVGRGDPSTQATAGTKPAVLALHGFGGTPAEVALVVEVAKGLGVEALAPLLPGHGTHPRDLARTRYSDWFDAAKHALDDLAEGGHQVIVAGLSMGTLLALDLALERPHQVAGLCLLSNSVWLKAPFPAWALGAANALRLPDIWLPKTEGPDIGDPVARRNHLTYNVQPSHAAIEVLRAGRRLRPRLGDIHCPTMLVHGLRDKVCSVKNVERVAPRLGTSDVEVVILGRSHHIVTRDVDKARVEEVVRRFIQRVSARPDQS
jgi:carboxylesterase